MCHFNETESFLIDIMAKYDLEKNIPYFNSQRYLQYKTFSVNYEGKNKLITYKQGKTFFCKFKLFIHLLIDQELPFLHF